MGGTRGLFGGKTSSLCGNDDIVTCARMQVENEKKKEEAEEKREKERKREK